MMIQKRYLLSGSMLLLAIGYGLWDPSSSLKAVKVLQSAPHALESRAEDSGQAEQSNASKSLSSRPQGQGDREPASLGSGGTKDSPAKEAGTIESETDFQVLLEKANLSTTISITRTTQLLRSADPLRIAAYFSKSLVDLGQKDNDLRERLVFIANELRSDELLPFWKDIIARKPARFEDETRYLEFGEPTEELQSIQLELLNSIRNVGLIAARDASATQVLSDLILYPSSRLHDDFIRERAFISLKEADLSASIRVLKSLDPKDSLRSRLLSR